MSASSCMYGARADVLTIGVKNVSVLCVDEMFVGANVCHVRSQEGEQFRLVVVDAEKLLSVYSNCTKWLESSPNSISSLVASVRIQAVCRVLMLD